MFWRIIDYPYRNGYSMSLSFIKTAPHKQHYVLILMIAFVLRAFVFTSYIQRDQRYQQPDSNDYHIAAVCMTHGFGMHAPNGRPVFWRTPGYPAYLSLFYDANNHDTRFQNHRFEQHRALWVQMFICSFAPLIMSSLALTLTACPPLAWMCAFIGTIHPGLILASTYLLTDGIAMILFMLFLVLFLNALRFPHESALSISSFTPAWMHTLRQHPYLTLLGAALMLGTYTWMRPMGQFVAIICTILLLFSAAPLKARFMRAVCFFSLFAALIAPWFVRNHTLTGSWFFCPLFGLYLNVFNAPKILARIQDISLKDAHTIMTNTAAHETYLVTQKARAAGDLRAICGENVCLTTALPVILAHPWYFLYDWTAEVLKTTFDLYASQLVALANDTFRHDPLVEYLPEKWAECLYAKPLPVFFRVLAWLEAISALVLWLGILLGVWSFILFPLWKKRWDIFYSYGYLWLKAGTLIGFVVGQTGGFGYARLRLPIEPLILIVALTFWTWWYTSRQQTFQ